MFHCYTLNIGTGEEEEKPVPCEEVVPSQTKSFACETCGKAYALKINLQMHMRSHTGENPGFNSSNLTIHPEKEDVNVKQEVYNKSLDYQTSGQTNALTYARKSNIQNYDMNHHGGYQYNFDPSNLIKDQTTDCNKHKPYKCTVCAKSFALKSHLDGHFRIHTGEKPYNCNTCGKKFRCSSNLTNHIRSHTGEKPYVCDICNRAFSTSKRCKIHRRLHTGEKPYSCDLCPKRFVETSALKSHIRTHTGEKPYMCFICIKPFRSSSTLKYHNSAKHAENKPFACFLCEKSFPTAATLASHEMSHTKPFSCDVCNKTFGQSKSLETHKLTHTGEKPVSCGVCGKGFAFGYLLTVH